MSSRISTKNKILNAAEKLFASSGFAETSMRQITNKAAVNLASINYHFGSKKDLTIEVIDRYLSHLLPEIQTELQKLKVQKPDYTVADVFNCFKQPLLDLEKINSGGTVCFLRLLGRGYVDVQGHFRKFITTKYSGPINEIQLAFQKSMPHLSQADIFWRLHFTLGTSIFTLGALEALTDIAKADFNQELTTEDVLNNLLPYIAAGFSS